MFDMSFYKGRRVLITGHTGFKGTWMSALLAMAGAEVTGYALEAPTVPSLFDLCGLSDRVHSVRGDVRDRKHLKEVFDGHRPEFVIHMAAQPIVRRSYQDPVYTYETNVMGTVNVLECVRTADSVKSVINVTTDKVYLNREWQWPYRENDELNGYDPYSNSKSCSELVTSSYINSFLRDMGIAVSTVRAGNVIGGGDFAQDRIIPDCFRAAQRREEIIVRNPSSLRPYEHVLEPIVVYLMIAKAQYEDSACAGCYNVGPDDADCLDTGALVSLFCDKWKRETGEAIKWVKQQDNGPHEAGVLRLDCSKLRNTFGWRPRWKIETTMEKIVRWYSVYLAGGDVWGCMQEQIMEFVGG